MYLNATTGNAITLNATNSTAVAAAAVTAVCTLSPHARALSSVLTAFVGAIIGGIAGGYSIAFNAAWICWLASLRILVVGAWAVAEALIHLHYPIEDGYHDFYEKIPGLRKLAKKLRNFTDSASYDVYASEPNFLGWVSWCWVVCYAPVVQTLWLMENWGKEGTGPLMLVRAIGVSITALPLTLDTRARYAVALGRIFGRWSSHLFELMTAVSCLGLGVIAATELVLGAIQIPVPWFVIVGYVFMLGVWLFGSLVFYMPHDGLKTPKTWPQTLAGLAMGIVGGCFSAAPAMVVLLKAKDSPGVDLATYLKCEPVALWKKLVAGSP